MKESTPNYPGESIEHAHESFWKGAYPLDPQSRPLEELSRISLGVLTAHFHILATQAFTSGEIPYTTQELLELSLPPLRKGSNLTTETVRLYLIAEKALVPGHKSLKTVFNYSQTWNAPAVGNTWEKFARHQFSRTFSFRPSTDYTRWEKIHEQRAGEENWTTLRAPLLRASAMFLLVDLLTANSWHSPVDIQPTGKQTHIKSTSLTIERT